MLVGAWIKRSRPDVYARIGEMGEEDLPGRAAARVNGRVGGLDHRRRARPRPVPRLRPAASRVPGGVGAGGRNVAGDDAGTRRCASPRSRMCSRPTCRTRRSIAASAARRSSPATVPRTGSCADRIDPQFRPHAVDGYIEALVGPIVDFPARAGSPSARRRSLMAELFEPVSVLSLAAVLGLGELDADTLRRWFYSPRRRRDELRARSRQAGAQRRRLGRDRRAPRARDRSARAQPDDSTHLPHDLERAFARRAAPARAPTCRA